MTHALQSTSPSLDQDIFAYIESERLRQQNCLELIASENLTSPAVIQVQGSVLTNKYAEGYPGARYYSGCTWVDHIERLAQERAKALFNCSYANVQPHSGSQANQAVYLALLKPGDRILGLSLDAGGHLTHGSPVNLSGKWFDAVSYGVHPETHHIDFDDLRATAHKVKPKLIIAGGSAYPQLIDFEKLRKIADEVGAFLMADIAHIAGLVATGHHPSPFPHAHVVTSTTHKTLRGPRGGLILSQDNALGKKFNSALFPGLQGGPLMHVIAGKAVAFHEALQPSYKTYISNVLINAKAVADTLKERGIHLVSHGTKNHLILIDLRGSRVTGAQLEGALETLNISTNKNTVPNDARSPRETSGLRLGAAACTTRGMQAEDFKAISHIIADVLDMLQETTKTPDLDALRTKVQTLCDRYPLPYSSLSSVPS